MSNQNPEHQRWEYEQNRAVAERLRDYQRELINQTNEAAVTAGNHALRALILINGGAAITMLAFIGNLVTADEGRLVPKLSEITSPMLWFASGVATAALALGLSYFTNYCMATAYGKRDLLYEPPFIEDTTASKQWVTATIVFQIGAVIAGLASLILFIIGMVDVSDVVTLLT